jgi:hypothetical protein
MGCRCKEGRVQRAAAAKAAAEEAAKAEQTQTPDPPAKPQS